MVACKNVFHCDSEMERAGLGARATAGTGPVKKRGLCLRQPLVDLPLPSHTELHKGGQLEMTGCGDSGSGSAIVCCHSMWHGDSLSQGTRRPPGSN